MSRSVLISVAMCTYSGERFLEQQLETIALQDRLPDELVVCDDGSTDGTVDLLQSFAARSPFPVDVHLNDQRLGPARNFEKAIRLCRGDLIALADQDDVWLQRKLGILEAAFAASPRLDGLFTDGMVIGADSRPLGYSLWQGAGFSPDEQREFLGDEPWRVLLKHSVATGATMAFRASVRQHVLPIPQGWLHDAWITFYLASRGRLGFLRDALIRYRHHGGNRIGMERRGATPMRQLISEGRRTSGGFYAEQSSRYGALIDRLSRPDDVNGSLIRAIRDKRDHFATRANMPPKRRRRVAVAIRELPRYRRWSNGWRSALKDVFLRP